MADPLGLLNDLLVQESLRQERSTMQFEPWLRYYGVSAYPSQHPMGPYPPRMPMPMPYLTPTAAQGPIQRADTERLQGEILEYFSLRDSGFDMQEVRIYRYVPIELYIEESGDASLVLRQFGELLEQIGFELVHAFDLRISSLGINFVARTLQKRSAHEHAKDLKEIKDLIETLAKDQSEKIKTDRITAKAKAFATRVDAIANFLKSLPKSISIAFATILISTFSPTGGAVVHDIGKAGIEAVLENPDLLKNPPLLLEKLHKNATQKGEIKKEEGKKRGK
jgi:hypothetical protein